MNFNWILKSHHKMCLDDGLIIENYGDNNYAMLKDEENKYSLFEIKQEINSNHEEIWEKITSSRSFMNFKKKVFDFMEGDNE